MKILLTGGAGYIGSHIAVELLCTDNEVIIADDFSNSNPDIIADIQKITGRTPVVYELNMTDSAGVDAMFRENRPDAVIHLAGYKAVGESVAEPLKYYRNNLNCAITLLEAMKNHDVDRLIFSSSATVYGAQDSLPYTEGMEHGRSPNPYGSTKQMIERIITDAAVNGTVSAVILRYFNPVGAHRSGLIGESPRGIPNNLMPFVTQVATGDLPELYVYGNDYPTRDGTGVRDYIHVVDLAKGHACALEYLNGRPGVEIINLGNGRGYSVLEIIDAFQRVNGIRIPYKIAARRRGDLPESFADTTRALALLGWKAELTLDDMCRDAYGFAVKNKKSLPVW